MASRGGGPACLSAALCLACLLTSSSCSSLHVAAGIPPFETDRFARTTRDGLTLEAHALGIAEEYWEVFEDNLPELGITAVWVVIRNAQHGVVSLQKCEWRLVFGGREYAAVRADAVLKLFYKAKRIRAVTIAADRHARTRLETAMLGPGRVDPEQVAQGFVFFRTDPSPSAEWTGDARLVVRGIGTAKRKPLDMELPLVYANPRS